MGEIVELRPGLATAVGPVPFTDVSSATSFVLSTMPEMPSVPSPGSGPHSLLAQAVDGVDGVTASRSGMLESEPERFDPDRATARAESAPADLGPSFDMTRSFLSRMAEHAAATAGFVGVRAALVGPVTLSLALRAAGIGLRPSMNLARVLVARRAAALLGALREVLPSQTVVMCLNEPGLVGAMHPTFPLGPDEVLALLDPTVQALDGHPRAGSLLIGAHVPGRTDWQTVVASGVSVVSVRADAGIVGWAATLGDFLERGGRVAWGAVPVDQPLGTSQELLWRRLSALWCELVGEGLDPLVLRRRSLVSPVDGLGHFGPSQAELALGLVRSLSVKVDRQSVAARLSLGA